MFHSIRIWDWSSFPTLEQIMIVEGTGHIITVWESELLSLVFTVRSCHCFMKSYDTSSRHISPLDNVSCVLYSSQGTETLCRTFHHLQWQTLLHYDYRLINNISRMLDYKSGRIESKNSFSLDFGKIVIKCCNFDFQCRVKLIFSSDARTKNRSWSLTQYLYIKLTMD